jgi:hypothetical protein
VAIIDLGEITAAGFEPPRPPAPVGRRPIRPVALAVVALLTLVTVTASVRPQPPRGLRPLWDIELAGTDTPYLAGDTVYVNRMNQDQDRTALTAYDAATGVARWTVDGPVNSYPEQLTSAGVLLQPVAMTEFGTGESTIGFPTTTVALDIATGARLWQMNAATVHTGGDAVLMSERDARGRVTKLRMVRQRDGGTIWSRALAANGGVAASDDAVATVDDRGGVTLLRWADGSVRRTGTMDWTPDRLQDGLSNGLDIVGEVLIHSRSDQRTTTSAVYRLDTLVEAWHGDGYVNDCETVLCSAEGDDQVGRDPITGVERWRLSDSSMAYSIGSGRLLADATRDAGLLLVDAATGRIVTTMGRGQLPWLSSQLGGRLLLFRSAVLPRPHITVIQIDPVTGEELTLGAVDAAGDDGSTDCQAGRHYLACPSRGRLYVTAVG